MITKFKWLWSKFRAWRPWAPKDDTNPRSKRIKGDPAWVLFLTHVMYVVNAGMGAVIIVALLMLAALNMGPQ